MQIVSAWTEESVEILPGARVDLGERPKTRPVRIAKAAMWVNDGDAEDLDSAKRYAASQGYGVVTFEGEADPLGAAKAAVLRGATEQAT